MGINSGSFSGEAKIDVLVNSNATEQFTNASKSLKSFSGEVNSTLTPLDKFNVLIDSSTSKVGNLNTNVGSLYNNIGNFPTDVEGKVTVVSNAYEALDNVISNKLVKTFTGFDNKLQPTVDKLGGFYDMEEKLSKRTTSLGKGFELLDIVNGKLRKGLTFTSNTAKNLENSFNNLGAAGQSVGNIFGSIADASDSANKLLLVADVAHTAQTTIEGLSESISEFTDSATQIGSVALTTGTTMHQMGGSAIYLQSGLGLATLSSNNLIKTIGKLGGTALMLQPLVGIFKTLGNTIMNVYLTSIEFYKGMETISNLGVDTTLIQITTQIGLMGEGLLFNINATKQFANTAVQEFARVQESVAFVRTLSTGAASTLTELTSTLGKFASDTLKNTVSIEKASEAMYNTLSAGIGDTKEKLNDTLSFMEAAAKLSKITRTDLNQTSTALIFAMKSFKIAGTEAMTTSAKLNAVIEEGVITLDGVVGSIGRLSAVASSAGDDINNAFASLAISSKTLGEDAGLGVTSLYNAITGMGAEAQKTLEEIGVRLDQQTIKEKGLIKALQDVGKATKGNAAMLKTIIPDSLAYSAALSIISAKAEDAERTLKGVANAGAGDIDRLFEESRGTILQRAEEISNGFRQLFIDAGQSINESGIFNAPLAAIEGLLGYFQKLPPAAKLAITSIMGFNLVLERGISIFTAVAGGLASIVLQLGFFVLFFRGGAFLSGFRDMYSILKLSGKEMSFFSMMIQAANAGLYKAIGLNIAYNAQTGVSVAMNAKLNSTLNQGKEILNLWIGRKIFETTVTEADNVVKAKSVGLYEILFVKSIPQLIAGTNAWIVTQFKSITANGVSTASFTGLAVAIQGVTLGLGKAILAMANFIKGVLVSPLGLITILVAGIVSLGLAINELAGGAGSASGKSKELAASFDTLSNSTRAFSNEAKIANDKLNNFTNDADKALNTTGKKYEGFINNWLISPLEGLANLLRGIGDLFVDVVSNIGSGLVKIATVSLKALSFGFLDFTKQVDEASNAYFNKLEQWKEKEESASKSFFTNLKDSHQALIDAPLWEKWESQMVHINDLYGDLINTRMTLNTGGSGALKAIQQEQKILAEMEKQAEERFKKLGDSNQDNAEKTRISKAIEAQKTKIKELNELQTGFESAVKETGILSAEQVDSINKAQTAGIEAVIDNAKKRIDSLKAESEQLRKDGKNPELIAAREETIKQLDKEIVKNEALVKSIVKRNTVISEFTRSVLVGTVKPLENLEKINNSFDEYSKKLEEKTLTAKTDLEKQAIAVSKSNADSIKDSLNDLLQDSETMLDNATEFQKRSVNMYANSVRDLAVSLSKVNDYDFDPELLRSKINSVIENATTATENTGSLEFEKATIKMVEETSVKMASATGKSIDATLRQILDPGQYQSFLELKQKVIDEDLKLSSKKFEQQNELLDHQIKTNQISQLDAIKTTNENKKILRELEIKAAEDRLKVFEDLYGKETTLYKVEADKVNALRRSQYEEALDDQQKYLELQFDKQQQAFEKQKTQLNKSTITGTSEQDRQNLRTIEAKELQANVDNIKAKIALTKEGSDERLKLELELQKALIEIENNKFENTQHVINRESELRERAFNKRKSLLEKEEISGITKETRLAQQKLEEDSFNNEAKNIRERINLYKKGSDERIKLESDLTKLLINEEKRRKQVVIDNLEFEKEQRETQRALRRDNLEKEFQDGNLSNREYQKQSINLQKESNLAQQQELQKQLSLYKKGSVEHNNLLKQLSSEQIEYQKLSVQIAENELDNLQKDQKAKFEKSIASFQKVQNQNTLYTKELDLQRELLSNKSDLLKSTNDIEIQTLENRLKKSNDIVKRAEIEYSIKEKQISVEQQNAEIAVQQLKLEEESTKANRENEQIQLRINSLEIERNIILAETDKKKAILEKRDITEIESIELQLEGLKQQQSLNVQNQKFLEKRIQTDKVSFETKRKVLDQQNEISKENGLIDKEIAKENIVISKYEKQLQILNLRNSKLEAASNIETKTMDSMQKSIDRQTQLINAKKQSFDSFKSIIDTQVSVLNDMSTSEKEKAKVNKEYAKIRIDVLYKEQTIELQVFELQQKQQKMTERRLEMENAIAISKQQAAIMETEIEAKKVLARKNATDEEKELALLQVKNAKEQLATLEYESLVIKQQKEDRKVMSDLEKYNLYAKQRNEQLTTRADVAKSTPGLKDDKEVRNMSREAIFSNIANVKNANINFGSNQNDIPDFKDFRNKYFKNESQDNIPTNKVGNILTEVNTLTKTKEMKETDIKLQSSIESNVSKILDLMNKRINNKAISSVEVNAPIKIEVTGDNSTDLTKNFGEQLNVGLNNLAINIQRRLGI